MSLVSIWINLCKFQMEIRHFVVRPMEWSIIVAVKHSKEQFNIHSPREYFKVIDNLVIFFLVAGCEIRLHLLMWCEPDFSFSKWCSAFVVLFASICRIDDEHSNAEKVGLNYTRIWEWISISVPHRNLGFLWNLRFRLICIMYTVAHKSAFRVPM